MSTDRFKGRVDLRILPLGIKKHVEVVGDGDDLERLTFCILNGAYVYLRGKGRVILEGEKEIRLGQ